MNSFNLKAKPIIKPSKMRVIEECKIFPPPNSTPSPTTLPLTFLDIPWLFFSPSKPLFFYEYNHSTSFFLSTTLPKLKHSLSISLQHFFPFLGNLHLNSCHSSYKPSIVYNEGNYVSFTTQESTSNFSFFTSNHARYVQQFHSLVPQLPTITTTCGNDNENEIPLLAIKITIFPNLGICIGLAFQHVAADARTFNNFIKTWASLCANSSTNSLTFLPSFDRSLFRDSRGLDLEEAFLKEYLSKKKISDQSHVKLSNMVRATFLVTLTQMEKVKNWILGKCKAKNEPPPLHLSPYVLTCSFIWVCLVNSQIQMGQSPNDDPIYFGFIAGGLTRLKYPVPNTYFGNYVGFGRCTTNRRDLMGDEGLIVAANVIENKIRELDKGMLDGAEKWILDWEVLFGSEIHVMISGSPKVDLYATDFGWGRPEKVEDISIDRNKAISLSESRDEKGGIEVGLALPNNLMQIFMSTFKEGLNNL